MKILVTDGYRKSNYIISDLVAQKYDVYFVHDDEKFASEMLEKYDINVFVGNSTDVALLGELSDIEFDILIALSNMDYRNYVVCKAAQKILKVNKIITILSTPNNRKTFSYFGIDNTVSASHIVSKLINSMTSLSEINEYIGIDEHDIKPLQISIDASYDCVGKQLKDINLPQATIIVAIIRGKNNIIPNGNDYIRGGDRVLLFTNEKKPETILQVLK